MVLVDVQGEEEEVIAEDVGLPCGVRKVVRIQIPVGGEEMRVVAVDRGVASPVGPSLDQIHVRVDNVVIKPPQGDEGLDVVRQQVAALVVPNLDTRPAWRRPRSLPGAW